MKYSLRLYRETGRKDTAFGRFTKHPEGKSCSLAPGNSS